MALRITEHFFFIVIYTISINLWSPYSVTPYWPYNLRSDQLFGKQRQATAESRKSVKKNEENHGKCLLKWFAHFFCMTVWLMLLFFFLFGLFGFGFFFICIKIFIFFYISLGIFVWFCWYCGCCCWCCYNREMHLFIFLSGLAAPAIRSYYFFLYYPLPQPAKIWDLSVCCDVCTMVLVWIFVIYCCLFICSNIAMVYLDTIFVDFIFIP